MTPLQISAKLACRDIYPPIENSSFSHLYSVGETECGIFLIDNYLYIAVQGSVDFADWVDDFDIDSTPHEVLGNLHSGFDRDLPTLIPLLLKEIPKGISVITCGHSAGAAKASILAARLKLDGVNVIQVYLFASPNPGEKEFSFWMQKNICGFSFWNQNNRVPLLCDPVPKVPLRPHIPTYPHVSIHQLPTGFKRLIPTAYHNAQLYYNQFFP